MYKIVFPKGRNEWVPKPILQERITHISLTCQKIYNTYGLTKDTQDLQDYDKPDTIPKNIATVERPLKDEVIAQHISRFPTQTLQQQMSQ